VALSSPFEYENKIIEKQNVLCRARGSFRHNGQKPYVGDNVTISFERDVCEILTNGIKDKEIDESGGGVVITEIHERKNSLIRPPLANIDYLFVCIATTSPEPNLITYDKLISIACYNKVEPVIILCKSDLDHKYANELYGIYSKTPHKCFILSSVEPESCNEISAYIKTELQQKTIAFAGASGVGKSTLLNLLFPDLSLSTAEVSYKTERGRHTTRHVELYPITKDENSGYIADTPGFSMLDFDRFDFFTKEDLPSTFAEFEPYLGECKYKKCTHTKEEGCAILNAVRENKIAKSRHDSYLDMYNILKNKNTWN